MSKDKRTQVVVPGLGEVVLNRNHFVAQGGEGVIYARDGLAYKVYHQADRVIPAGKLVELAGFVHPSVVRPEQMITDMRGRDVGFVMRYLPDTWPLCRLFTRAFRDRHGLGWSDMMRLLSDMAQTLEQIHAAGMCVVDLNDQNLRASADFRSVYFIDVDSWQTARYPATAVTDATRDPLVVEGVFTPESDWYAFAVVGFQLLMGIHPYKGKHPRIHGLQARMDQDLSVFNPDVQLPAACTPLDALPARLRDWFVSTFEQGQRTPLPDLMGTRLATIPQRVGGDQSGELVIEELRCLGAPIEGIWSHRGDHYAVTAQGLFRNAHRIGPAPKHPFVLGFSGRRGRPVVASLGARGLRLEALDPPGPVVFEMDAKALCAVDGCLIVQVGSQLLEVVLQDLGDRIVATPRPVANVLRHATTLYDGVALQDLMGETWAVLLSGTGSSQTVRLPELDAVQVLGARWDRGVLMVAGRVDGAVARWVFRVDGTQRYDVRRVVESVPAIPSFVTLDTGVCICRTEEESLAVFHASPGMNGLRRVTDPAVAGELCLAHGQGRLLVGHASRLLHVSLARASAA